MKKLRRAAFFDLDGTVLRIESGTSWMRFLHRRGEVSTFEMLRTLYWSLLYKSAILDMESLARRLVADMMGQPEADLLRKSAVWYASHVESEITPAARCAIESHRRHGDMVILLSASTQYAAESVGRGLDMDHVLCSRLEVEDGLFTGRLETFCFGEYKVDIAESFASRHGIDVERSFFYSDSFNDLPMLERVGAPVVVNPDLRLRLHARRVGWRMERWP